MYDQGILGFVQAAMLFFFPPLWMGMLGWAGYNVGNGMGIAMSKGSPPASNAGKSGGGKAQSGAIGGNL